MDLPAARNAATVAVGDIARLTDVGRAAVSNWRRRFPDFPTPVGGSSASPLFALDDIEKWLTRHDKPFEVTPSDRVWQLLRGASTDLELGGRIGHLGAFLVFLARNPGRWKSLAGQPDFALVRCLSEQMRAAEPELADLLVAQADHGAAAIVRLTAAAARVDGHRAVFDFLCERYREVHSRRHSVTPAPVAALMVALTASSGDRLLDPACGIGTLLLAADTARTGQVCGQEVDRTAACIALARLLLHGSDARVAVADSLGCDAYSGELFDAVVCNPPFGDRSWGHDDLAGDPRWEHGLPPRGEPELAWVQHCLAHVRPGGRVAILMPAAAASRRSGRRIRASLLRAGALCGVISLPPTGPAGAVTSDLWLLRRGVDVTRPRDVLVVDARAEPGLAELAWRAYFSGSELPTGSRAVPIVDLLDGDVDLTPAMHVAAADASEPAFPPVLESLRVAAAQLVPTLPKLTVSPPVGGRAMTTIGELTRAGAVTIRQAPMSMSSAEDGPASVMTARDVRLGRPPSGTARNFPGAVILQAGDVLVPLAPRTPAVHVVREDGPLLGPRLYLLRVDPEQLDPYFLAGFLRSTQRCGGSGGSSLAARFDIRRSRLPRLPVTEQRRYGDAFRQLMAFEVRLRETTALGEELVERGFQGLGDESLRPAAAD
ncbi:SAM-dependent methyltransferase [Micromonospora luteifusca]|uniref:SAM-dependent methyltransferase n=1 Tax=Micromonospora luteifusca TaxID=709860 RepID=A0ABS2LLV2_9ACTN|nr:N-6 DNA methylase [Micromonospora luteifusca]MBM7489141.1 SAM-dependent methyltransferase [Micromonospora luteifusca]